MTGDDWYIVITEMDSDHWLENLFLIGLTIHIFTVASANSHGLDFSALCGRHAIAQSIPEKKVRDYRALGEPISSQTCLWSWVIQVAVVVPVFIFEVPPLSIATIRA